MEKHLLDQINKLHIIGIGGSGTYPLVQIFHEWGYTMTGSDNNPGDTIEKERKLGIPVTIGHDAANVGDVEAVLYSAAIPESNPEIQEAVRRGIPLIPRAEALGYISSRYTDTISISGTHGKTSTTAMLTQLLLGADLDPTAIIGGSLPLIDGYGRSGNSSVMVVEACEYKDTYHHLNTDIGVILNVDEDHLEYFKNLENIIASFRVFAQQAKKVVIVNGEDENSMKVVEGLDKEILTFGYKEGLDYRGANVRRISPTVTRFQVFEKGTSLGDMEISVPGEHHIMNALAAIGAARYVGADVEKIREHLPQFKGAGRRFELMGIVNGIHIVDDYAHHPLEIANTLKVAQTMGFGKVWAVHQPFTYSRTALLLDDFAEALSHADHVVLSKIMGGRETNTYQIDTKDLAEKIPGSVWFPEFPEIADYVMSHAEPNDLVITLGCGDVYKCARMMVEYK